MKWCYCWLVILFYFFSTRRSSFDAFSDVVRAVEVDRAGLFDLLITVHLRETLKSLRQVPDIEGVLSCQLTVSQALVFLNVAVVLDARVLEAVEGPLSLELFLASS